ncbi:MAG: DegT/DnrJ/EryC1/StrS family aminotransferase [Opitutaceae bacterium]|nr:DegT/DnrJ/EryC1/StrS family aminotransferase [Opitutaceae bacterium]
MPIVDEPFPRPTRWGEPELARLTTMLGQTSLFYWKGPQTAALLEEFHKLYPFRFLAPCSSGTASLHIALAALRLRPGDEVIVPPITDMGSVIGVLYQQAVPVFADLDPGTYNLDPAAVRNAITSRTRAIMVVHLAGNPCDMRAILPLAREHRLAVIEDCAQAWGAEHEGRPVGSFGDFGCYSFNDYKHISCGDGGMVGTQSEQYGVSLGKWGDKSYDRVAGERDIALLRDPADLAPNYRITEPQAAIAAAQLPKLGGIVTRRIQIATRLNEALGAIPGIQPPVTRPGDKHSFWFYLFRLELERFRGGQAGFAEALRAEGVNLSAGYLPKPLYGYRVFQNHNFFGGAWPVRDFGLTRMDYRQVRCPVAEAILGDSILLYMNEAFSDGYVAKLIRAVESVARRLTR